METIKNISATTVLAVAMIVVSATGAFYTVEVGQRYTTLEIQSIKDRLETLEAREREDREILIRLESSVNSIKKEIDRLFSYESVPESKK